MIHYKFVFLLLYPLINCCHHLSPGNASLVLIFVSLQSSDLGFLVSFKGLSLCLQEFIKFSCCSSLFLHHCNFKAGRKIQTNQHLSNLNFYIVSLITCFVKYFWTVSRFFLIWCLIQWTHQLITFIYFSSINFHYNLLHLNFQMFTLLNKFFFVAFSYRFI